MNSATPAVTSTQRFDGSGGPRIIGPADSKSVDLDTLGVRSMIWGEESGGDFSLVEHPIPPRGLCAPLHRHSREDEYSFVLEGRMGAQLGDDVVFAEVGDLVFKPRDQWQPSGTRATRRAASWRSSPRPASSGSSTSSARERNRRPTSALATASNSISTASDVCSRNTDWSSRCRSSRGRQSRSSSLVASSSGSSSAPSRRWPASARTLSSAYAVR